MVLSRGARRILFLIQKFSKRYGRSGAWFGQKWLAKQFKCCTRTIKRWVAELRKAGLISAKKRYKKTNVYSLLSPKTVPSELPSGVRLSVISRAQHHLSAADDAVRKTAGMERLSEGDRRWLAGLRRSGTAESAIRAGILIGRARKLASRSASETIRSLRYFSQTIAEAPALPNGYLEHIEHRLRRLA